ncbi:hypothetical protein JCM30237_25270 [Halolamina litorea]|uniref:Right-handed parallel beta-helix repeat-containing protein n=1 Tax=Halolamina litorea TaxID=1515593 RepID=A0ABD6BV90_9EURY|nr:right-handed parallel beta-helix repeat-containing protein [Halolamina litorea]
MGDPTTSTPEPWDYRERVQSSHPETVADRWGLDSVTNLADLGADTDGNQPIDDLLKQHADDGTLLYFPPGEYRIEDTVALNGATDTDAGPGRLGLLGDDATIVPAEGFDTVLLTVGYPDPLSSLLVRGFTFDFTAENTGARPISATANDLVVLRDLSVDGVVDVPQDVFRLDVTSPDGKGFVHRLSLPDGSTEPGVTGCEVGDDNHGDVTFLDCRIDGFPDNGLYADPPEGSIKVHGGSFRNNGVASVRITTSEPSEVRGVHVRCDDADAVGKNMRGIRLRGGHDHVVEDCLVEMLKVPSSDGAITIASELESATIRNCRIRVDADGVNALRVKQPNSGAGESVRHGPFGFENVRITGDAAGGAAVQASGRENCSFRGLCIHQPGDDRDGIVTTGVGGEVVDTCVSVTNEPLSFSNSTIERRNVRLSSTPDEKNCDDEGAYQPLGPLRP